MTQRPSAPSRTSLALAGLLALLATQVVAEPLAPTGGAGNTGVRPPPAPGGDAGDRLPSPPPGVAPGATGNRTVPGTTPGVNIGGTPTAGPPGTGGAAGGPGFGNR